MDCIVYGVAKSRTRLNDFHFPQVKASQRKKNRQMDLHKIKRLFIVKETINKKNGILLKSLFANDILKKGLII